MSFVSPLFLLSMATIGWFILTPHIPITLEAPFPATHATPPLPSVTPTRLFTEQTHHAQLFIPHRQVEHELTSIEEALGAGACILDFDNDGLEDLLLVTGQGQNRYYGRQVWWNKKQPNLLYRNLGQGQFKEQASIAGLTEIDWGMGCATADLDNDGDQDIFLSNRGHNRLYQNNGDGTFSNITQSAGIRGADWSTSVALADVDGNGLLDLYVVNYLNYGKGDLTFEADTGFHGLLSHRFNPKLYEGAANQLYLNQGNMRFIESADRLGVSNAGGRGLSALWHDINGDHLPDLFIANSEGLPNRLLLNHYPDDFEDVSLDYGIKETQTTASLLLNGYSRSQQAAIFQTKAAGFSNRLLLVNDDQQWQDKARSLALSQPEQLSLHSWGGIFQDLNNDGITDLYVANGLAKPDMTAHKVSQGQPDGLFLGQSDGFFDCSLPCLPQQRSPLSSRAVISADLDNDGDLELLITHNNDIPSLLWNQTQQQHWLGVVLQGTDSNRDGIGAEVSLKTSKGTQTRWLQASGFLGTSSKRLHFGLGDAEHIQQLTVRWPSGQQQSFNALEVDQYLLITEGVDGVKVITSPNIVEKTPLNTPFTEDQYILQFLAWQLDSPQQPIAESHLLNYIHHPDPLIRRDLIQIMQSRVGSLGLRVLLSALEDPVIDNQLAALTGLTYFEAEASMSWLLKMLDSPDAEVVCATTALFYQVLGEEEALVIRKYQAVPALIRLLEHPKASVRQCATQALSEAEHYAAVIPLTRLLSDPDLQVAIQAAEALGLIRERIAVAPLTQVVQQKTAPMSLRTEALVALHRLNKQAAFQLLRQPSTDCGKETDCDSQDTIALIHHLLIHPTGRIIFQPNKLTELLWQWVNTIDAVSPQLLNALQQAHDSRALPLATSWVTQTDPAVQRAAWQLLFSLLPPQKASVWMNRALQQGSAIQRIALDYGIAQKVALPMDSYRLSSIDSKHCGQVIELITRDHPQQIYDQLQQTSPLPICQTSSVADMLDALRKYYQFELDADHLYQQYPQATHAIIRYWSKQQQRKRLLKPPVFIKRLLALEAPQFELSLYSAIQKRKEPWALHRWQTVLLNRHGNIATRQRLLEGLTQIKPIRQHQRLFETLLNHWDDPLWIHLFSHHDLINTPRSQDKIAQLLTQVALTEAARFHLLAAQQSASRHTPSKRVNP